MGQILDLIRGTHDVEKIIMDFESMLQKINVAPFFLFPLSFLINILANIRLYLTNIH